MNRKGQLGLNSLPSVAIVFVVLIVTVAIGAFITSTIGGQLTEDSTAQNVTIAGEEAFETFSSWFGILIVVTVAAVILGLLGLFFAGSMEE
jgi:hypothetical protein